MKNTFTKKARYLGLKLTAMLFVMLLISGESWGQLFQQQFNTDLASFSNSNSNNATYINASPSNSQFTYLGSSGTSATISISSNKLTLSRTGNGWGFARGSAFSGPPSALIIQFDYSTTGATTAVSSAVIFAVGGGSTAGSASTSITNSDVHSRLAFNCTATSGQFLVRDVAGSTNGPTTFTGTQTIRFVINNSGTTLTYKAPNGTYESIGDDKFDVWVGTSKELDERSATTTTQSLSYFKCISTSGNQTVNFSNMLIDPIPSIPTSNSATSINKAGFSANWTTVTGVTGYRLDVSTTSDFSSFVTGYNNLYVSGQATSSYSVTGLNSNTQYFYRVRGASQYAVSEFGSGNSNSISVTTKKATETVTGTSNFSALTNIGSETDITVSGDLTIDVLGECHNLTITSAGKTTITPSKGLIVNGNLLLHSDASGTASLKHNAADLTVTGSTTVERYITQYTSNTDGWRFVSSPVNNAAIGNFAPATNDDFYAYDEVTNTWLNYKVSPFDFTNGIGYLSAYETSATKSFSGSINTSDITFNNLSYTTAQGKGWHLLGNPFASAIKWNDGSNWALNNVSTTAKILNSGGSYVDLSENDIIPAMQGFLVQVSGATNSIKIPAASRTHSSSNLLNKAATEEKLTVRVSSTGNNTYVESIIKTNNNATSGFDANYDANFLAGMYGVPQLYSAINNAKLSTNTIPSISSNVTIPMGFVPGLVNNYKLTVEGINTFTSCSAIILEDLKTNTTQNLIQNPVYNFTASTTDNVNRFILHFTTSVGVNETGKTNTGIYAYDNNIYVNGTEQIRQIAVYNTLGQLVKLLNNVNGLQKISMNGNATGYYVVKVITDSKVFSEKVLVK